MKKSLLALILASVVVMSLSAQFSAETRLVIVNLSAKDKSGRPIMTLKKEDVEVFEGHLWTTDERTNRLYHARLRD